MKKSKVLILCILCFIMGLSIFASASTYNSEEISYDTSASGAVQANVKDALDFLYNKTKSGAASECPENMSCVEKPGVTMNVSGPGSVDKGTVYVGIGETNTFTVTPNSGYALHSISCNNGYTLSSFSTVTTSVQPSLAAQTITITNPNTANGTTCTIIFGSNEINVTSSKISSYKGDACNENSSGCICYQIAHNVTNFTYEGHTGCNFKSSVCTYTYGGCKSGNTSCSSLNYYDRNVVWTDGNDYYGADNSITCSGVITCAT